MTNDDPGGDLRAQDLYRRWAGARGSSEAVMAALAGSGAFARPGAGARPAGADAARSPAALYRRYRETRGTGALPDVPDAARVDAVLAAVRAAEAARAASGGSALERLFRWPGRALDRLLAAGGGPRLAVPALALAAAALAVVPLVVLDRGDGPAGDASVASVPASLLREAGAALPAIDAVPTAGLGFAGADPATLAFRLGATLADLVVAAAAPDSDASTRARARLGTTLGALAATLDDADAAARVETVRRAAAAPAGRRLQGLGAATDALRAALVPLDPLAGPRFDLGRGLGAAALAAALAADGGADAPLEDALDALGRRVPAGGGALPATARAELEALTAPGAAADPDEVARRAARLRLLLE